MRATDVAGNTDASPASYTWLVDTTAPSSTTSFPAASGEYNSSGWAAGCATAGLCGTYADGSGSGVSQVQVSIRQGSGQLLERIELRERERGLEHGLDRRRQLVVRLRRGQLPRRRQLHHAGARDRRRRQRGDAVEPNVHVRHHEPERALHLPRSGRQLHELDLERGLRDQRLLRHTLRRALRRSGRPGLDPSGLERPLLERYVVRVGHGDVPDRRPRRCQLVARLPGVELPGRRAVHRSHPRARRRAEHRERPFAHVPNRQHCAVLRRHLPGRRRHLQHRRLECGMRDERPLRHPVRRRLRHSGRRALDPPGRGQLLERLRLLERHRGLEHSQPRGWQLVADLPCGELPGRRRLHGAGARDRRRRQRRDPVEPLVHDRPRGAADDDRLEPGRPDLVDERELHVQLERRRLDVRVPDRRRLLGRLHEPEELREPRRRQPHLRRARHRRRRQHRRLARLLHLAGRHRGAVLDASASPPPPARTTRPAGTPAARRTASAGPTRTAPAPASPRSRSRSARARATTGTAPASPVLPKSGATRPSPAATGRSPSRPAASRPTAATRCASARSTTPRTPRLQSSRSFTIDRAAPQTTIDSNPADPTSSTSASFDFSASEGSSSFECRIDAGSWGACTSPKSYASLADGSHTFDVRATDVAGNTDGSPASFTWLVDTAAPSSTTTFPASSGSYTSSRVGCRLRYRGPLRNLRRRLWRRRRRGRGLDPARLRELLGRLRVHERERGLERLHARGRQLVVQLRLHRLPRRRRLHGARAGSRTTSATPKRLRAGPSPSTRQRPPDR